MRKQELCSAIASMSPPPVSHNSNTERIGIQLSGKFGETRIDSVMRPRYSSRGPRYSSRGRNTSASVTVTEERIRSHECQNN